MKAGVLPFNRKRNQNTNPTQAKHVLDELGPFGPHLTKKVNHQNKNRQRQNQEGLGELGPFGPRLKQQTQRRKLKGKLRRGNSEAGTPKGQAQKRNFKGPTPKGKTE